MPNNVVTLSGSSSVGEGPFVYVNYDKSYFSPNPNKSQDIIPTFMYLGGSVAYEQDQFGNMIARNRSGGEAPA